MIYILYSDDYELFFGENLKREKDVLIDTTDELLGRCGESRIPMTFFCDVACIWRYRELGLEDFPAAVEHQLGSIIRQGYDVQAHLHPHWLNTHIERDSEGRAAYRFARTDFLLSEHSSARNGKMYEFASLLLKRARDYLETLLQPHDPDYRCIAYRAGGFGIQPDTKVLLSAMLDAGYKIDSSVVPGMMYKSSVNRIDFSRVPHDANYFLSPMKGLSGPADSGIFEIPIASADVGSLTLMRNTLRTWITDTSHGNRYRKCALGRSVQSLDGRHGRTARLAGYVSRIVLGWGMLELSKNPGLMLDITRKYIDSRIDGAEDIYFALNCHSKGINKLHLDSLQEYHSRLNKLYGDSVRAITFRDAAKLAVGKNDATRIS